MSSAGRACVLVAIATVGSDGAPRCASGTQHAALVETASSARDPSFTAASLLGSPGFGVRWSTAPSSI
jgi:hypothetical protein